MGKLAFMFPCGEVTLTSLSPLISLKPEALAPMLSSVKRDPDKQTDKKALQVRLIVSLPSSVIH